MNTITEKWVTDARGNRASVDHFESETAARASLATLVDCWNCTNCVDCTRCTDCAHCFDCVDSWFLAGCDGCVECSYSSGLSTCALCTLCVDCIECRACSNCFDLEGAVGDQGQRVRVPRVEYIHERVFAVAHTRHFDMRDPRHSREAAVLSVAGARGRELAHATSAHFAAICIYRVSDPTWRMSNFFASTWDALADIAALARRHRADHASRDDVATRRRVARVPARHAHALRRRAVRAQPRAGL